MCVSCVVFSSSSIFVLVFFRFFLFVFVGETRRESLVYYFIVFSIITYVLRVCFRQGSLSSRRNEKKKKKSPSFVVVVVSTPT